MIHHHYKYWIYLHISLLVNYLSIEFSVVHIGHHCDDFLDGYLPGGLYSIYICTSVGMLGSVNPLCDPHVRRILLLTAIFVVLFDTSMWILLGTFLPSLRTPREDIHVQIETFPL